MKKFVGWTVFLIGLLFLLYMAGGIAWLKITEQ